MYKRIQNNQDDEWRAAGLTANWLYEIKVKRGKTYQFKVVGVNKYDNEGMARNIETVKVLGKIRFSSMFIKDIIK